MTTIHLRFVDAATGLAVLTAAGLTGPDESGGAVVPPLVMSETGPVYLDVVFGTGVIAAPSAEASEAGEAGDGLAAVPGWHVNMLAPDGWTLPEPLAAAVVTPEHPACVFAGA